MKVYYAHCQAIYGKPIEQRDIAMLETLGFQVVNPGLPEHGPACAEFARQTSKTKMDYFLGLVDECDMLVFRALPDGSIPAGVAKEIEWARVNGKPVLELPSCMQRRALTLEQTREYLGEIGQR
jgi:hypothetical protein